MARLVPKSVVDLILRDGGAKRLTKGAVEYTKVAAEEWIKDIGKKASVLAKHGKRVTVSIDDIKLAIKGAV